MESTIPSSLSASSSLTTRYTLNENEKGDAFSTSESAAAVTATNLKSFSRSRLEQLLKEHDIQRSQAAATLHNNRPPAQVICISTPHHEASGGTGSVQSSRGSGKGHGHGPSHLPSAFAPVFTTTAPITAPTTADATATTLLSNLSIHEQAQNAPVVRKTSTLLPPGRRVDSDDDHGQLELGMTTSAPSSSARRHPNHGSSHAHSLPPQDAKPMIPHHHAVMTQRPNTMRHHNGTTTSGNTSRPYTTATGRTTKQPPPMVVTEVVVPLSMSQQQKQQPPQPLPVPVPPSIHSAPSTESISPLEKSPTIWEEHAVVNNDKSRENDNASVHSDDAIHEPSPPPALEPKAPGEPQPLESPPAPSLVSRPQPLPLLQQQHSKSYSRSSRRSLLSSCGSRRSLATSMGTYSNRSLLSRATSRGSTALELECLMMRSTCSSTWSSTGAGVGAGTLNQATTTMPQTTKVLPNTKQEQSAQAAATTTTTTTKRAKSTTPPGFIRNVTHASVRHLQQPDNPVPNLDGRTKPNAVTTSDESTFINEEEEDASSTTPSDPRAPQRQRLDDDRGHVDNQGTTDRASEHHTRRSHRSRHDKTHGDTTTKAHGKNVNQDKRQHLGVVPFTTIRLVRPVAQPPQPARPSS